MNLPTVMPLRKKITLAVSVENPEALFQADRLIPFRHELVGEDEDDYFIAHWKGKTRKRRRAASLRIQDRRLRE